MTSTRRRFLQGSMTALACGLSSTRAFAEPPKEGREILDGAKLDGLLASIAKARQAVRSLRADFVQERKMSLLATSVTSTGQLTFLAGSPTGRLRWELAPPDDVVYWVGPEGLAFRTRSSSSTMPAAGANVGRALADLRALLTGDLSELRARYVLGGSRSGDDAAVNGTSKDAAATIRGFTLVLDKGLVLPKRARLLEGKSDTIDLVFSNGAINPPVDPARMRP